MGVVASDDVGGKVGRDIGGWGKVRRKENVIQSGAEREIFVERKRDENKFSRGFVTKKGRRISQMRRR